MKERKLYVTLYDRVVCSCHGALFRIEEQKQNELRLGCMRCGRQLRFNLFYMPPEIEGDWEVHDEAHGEQA